MKRLLATVAATVALSSAVAFAQVPHLIDCQGRLTDASGNPLEGSYKVTFSIYDVPVGGEPVWQEKQEVTTGVDGLFQVQLGSKPLTGFVFKDSARYLGIQVADDPELTPRIHLTSVPYAYHSLSADVAETASSAPNYLPLAGGTMTGTTFHNSADSRWQSAGSFRVGISPDFSLLSIVGANNNSSAALEGTSGGLLTLYDGQPENNPTAVLNGNWAGGGSLQLSAPGGNLIEMDAAGTGDNSVILPQGAIDATEILNEPGIAAAQLIAGTILQCGPAIDLLLVTISIPAPGYIVLDGKFTALLEQGELGAVADFVGGWVQIDENSGGLFTQPYHADFAYTNDPRSNGVHSWIGIPTSVYRIYYKPEGTYTFRLEGAKYVNCGPGFVVIVSDCMLRATYYPSSYGSVTTLVSATEAGQFDKAEAVSVPTGIDGKGPATTMYQVDLRELELKAARVRAEAEKLERQLTEAKMQHMQQQMKQSNAKKE